MQAVDVNSLFARAEQAFVNGRLEAARADLAQVQRLAGDHPAVLHLLALVEKKSGNLQAARAAFEQALKISPNDPQINNNYANLLDGTGDQQAALAHFDRALKANPQFADARFNRALLLHRLGRLEDALAELERSAAASPPSAKVQSARGALLRELGRLTEAAEAYDAALRLEPTRVRALHGRARTAMELGESGAAELYRRALVQKPSDRELLLGLAQADEAEGGTSAIKIMEEAVRRFPSWVEGHEQLSRMRSEAGFVEDHACSYREALVERANDLALHKSYWNELGRGGLYAEALRAIEEARSVAGDDPGVRLTEAMFASEAGELERATRLFEELARDGQDVWLAWGRHLLRLGEGKQAAARLERATEASAANVAAWAHLSLAWRLTNDPRHQWLCEQPGLIGTLELGLDKAELDRLTSVLRGLHRSRAHPVGQSLRGGTQTRGALFDRREAEIVALRDRIRTAVAEFSAKLPARDDRHPLLRHRDSSLGFSGSWSVRLRSSGFHINHIHPLGVLSSACYISLPPSIGSNGSRDGWLEVGSPPAELGLPLGPLASIEPRPGRLALFPSYMFHGTRPFADGERLTVAFDVAAR